MGLHRQLDRFAFVFGLPAQVSKRAEVFAELDPHSLGEHVLAVLLQGDPDVADPAQVIADQLIEAVSLLFVERRRGISVSRL